MTTMFLTFPMPDQVMTANQRLHWAKQSTRTKSWRWAARIAAHGKPAPTIGTDQRAVVTVTIPVVGNRRRDPSNWMPTVKPIVDGLTDAGLWPDDDSRYVSVSEPVLDSTVKDVHVRIEIVTVTPSPIEALANDIDDEAVIRFTAALRTLDAMGLSALAAHLRETRTALPTDRLTAIASEITDQFGTRNEVTS